MAEILREGNIFLSGGLKWPLGSQIQPRNTKYGLSKEEAKLNMLCTPHFPLIIRFKGLQLPRLSVYCQRPRKAALGEEIQLLICLQIQFPSVLLTQQSTDIFWSLACIFFPPTESSVFSLAHSSFTV